MRIGDIRNTFRGLKHIIIRSNQLGGWGNHCLQANLACVPLRLCTCCTCSFNALACVFRLLPQVPVHYVALDGDIFSQQATSRR